MNIFNLDSCGGGPQMVKQWVYAYGDELESLGEDAGRKILDDTTFLWDIQERNIHLFLNNFAAIACASAKGGRSK